MEIITNSLESALQSQSMDMLFMTAIIFLLKLKKRLYP